jgi:hypothetical protein
MLDTTPRNTVANTVCYNVLMANTIKDLLGTHPKELLDELIKVREQEQLIVHERELLERLLEILVENGGPAAEWLLDPARGLLTVGPVRAQVLRVMDTAPADRGWQPREVYEQLVAAGNNKVTLDNVRITMSRMATGESPELIQPEPHLAMYVRAGTGEPTPGDPSEEAPDDA